MNLLTELFHPTRHGSSRLPTAWPKILLATGVALVVDVLYYFFDKNVPTISATPFTVMGVAISIFLGFRNNTAYTRFWEARTLWGALINSSRTFARQVITLIPARNSDVRPFQEDVVMATVAYGHALREHLHGNNPVPVTEGLMLPEETEWLKTQNNVPVAILHLIGRRLGTARECGWISDPATIMLESTLRDITNVQGGCERIKNTPIPETYGILSNAIVTFFCMFLPFGILDTAKWMTPVVVFLVSYAFFGLSALGEEVEQPFEDDPHDLPLAEYTNTIETNLRQILSDRDLPSLKMSGGKDSCA